MTWEDFPGLELVKYLNAHFWLSTRQVLPSKFLLIGLFFYHRSPKEVEEKVQRMYMYKCVHPLYQHVMLLFKMNCSHSCAGSWAVSHCQVQDSAKEWVKSFFTSLWQKKKMIFTPTIQKIEKSFVSFHFWKQTVAKLPTFIYSNKCCKSYGMKRLQAKPSVPIYSTGWCAKIYTQSFFFI